MTSKLRAAILLASLLILAGKPVFAMPSIETRLTWLPTGTEEIYSGHGAAIPLPERGKIQDLLSTLISCLASSPMAFDRGHNGDVPLKMQSMSSCLRGSQTRPASAQVGTPSSCAWSSLDIFTFEKNIRNEMTAYLATQPLEQIKNGPDIIWKTLKTEQKYDPVNSYLVMPDESTMFVCKSNSPALILDSLKRYHSKTVCPVDSRHPGWNYIDKDSQFWSLAILPPRLAASAHCNDGFAASSQALTSQYNPRKSPVYQFTCLAKTHAADLVRGRMKQAHIAESARMKIVSHGDKLVEIDISPGDRPEYDIMAVLAMMQALLCHQVILGS